MKSKESPKYPGTRAAMDGNTAVIMCERESTDAAGAYPITPSTQMGEYWAMETAAGHINVSGKPLIFVEPEGEHAAAAVTAGMAMTGLRSANFSSGQGIAYMHESLYAAVGKRLTYVLNMGCRAMTKASLNVHAGHDDYHSVDDTGFFQLFGKNVQEACDLNILAHKIAELALTPGIVGQDGFLTTHLIESMLVPERELIAEFLGKPSDMIECPTPAQQMVYGKTRRRIPLLWDVDNPLMTGVVQNQDSYAQSVAGQRPYYFDEIEPLIDKCMQEFTALTGRPYSRVSTYNVDDADYLLVGQGSVIPSAEEVSDYLRKTRNIKVGVVNITCFRPFPGALISKIIKGRKGVTVLERLDQPLAEDLPLIREIRASLTKCQENGISEGAKPYPKYDTYEKLKDLPPLFSGSFGMGSRDLQPEGLIAAVENMMDDKLKRKFYYLSIDFLRDKALSPKQEIYQQELLEKFPRIKDLSIRGSENPNLMPKGAITVRFHSIGGWGAITTGKNLGMTLFDLLGYHIKANPKYGSEKKGQPTTYYLAVAPEPIRINCEYYYVDVVMSPDPNVFKHTNALAGLKERGVFIIQSDLGTPEKVWADIPLRYQKLIREMEIKIHFIDAFQIARDEASDSELQLRMQGIAFQGSFFSASPVMAESNFTEESLFQAIEEQLEHKFGAKGRRVVNDNMRVVKRGFQELQELDYSKLPDNDVGSAKMLALPPGMDCLQQKTEKNADIHRFWEQTGNFYITGQGNDNITDPFIASSWIPASTGIFRDMTGIRFQHPVWKPENCTACGKCWVACPDSAMPTLVNDISQVIETTIKKVERSGTKVTYLRKVARTAEKKIRKTLVEANGEAQVSHIINTGLHADASALDVSESEREVLQNEFDHFQKNLEGISLSTPKPFFGNREKKAPGQGGLLSIMIDPYRCKGCMECVAECNDNALEEVPQSAETVALLQKKHSFWEQLPNTPKKYINIDNLDEGVGTLPQLLLNKDVYDSMVGGDGACLGCGEKTVVHLFTSTVAALMQDRVKAHVEKLDSLISKLETQIKMKLTAVKDSDALVEAMEDLPSGDVSVSDLSKLVDKDNTPLDKEWLTFVSGLLRDLKKLKDKYTATARNKRRSDMGMLNATGCTSVWGSTFPFNPYPFPWSNHLFQDCTSVAMGVFEGHMQKMAEGFKTIRKAELELEGEYQEEKFKDFFTYFKWEDFSDEEFLLCPPVVAVGGDGALYDIGFQNLSRVMMSGKPIKVLTLDTQVYSNTGGQACTSGFYGQISDMAWYGKAIKGKEEIRKEVGLIAMGHRTTYVLQSSMANPSHVIEGFIEGLNARRPALFNLYTSCQPEHGIGDELSSTQARMALESRAYPLFKYNPDKGTTLKDCLDLEGNPSLDDQWPLVDLEYQDENGVTAKKEIPITFADFAGTEARFRKHYKTAKRDTWNENMVPVHEYIELDLDEREDKVPYIWVVNKKKQLSRVVVAEPVIASTEDRKNFWNILRGIAGTYPPVESTEDLKSRLQTELMGKFTQSLYSMLGNEGEGFDMPLPPSDVTSSTTSPSASGNGQVAPWIDTPDCTSCDDCLKINPKVFVYNEDKKATLSGVPAPYKDLVKAAEKCTAQIIHPGVPADTSDPEIAKLVKRAAKYND